MTGTPDTIAELEEAHAAEAYAAHAASMAARLDDLRTSLAAARTTVRKTLLDLGEIHDEECGGDCCLGYTGRTSVIRFLEDADHYIAAARALLRLENP